MLLHIRQALLGLLCFASILPAQGGYDDLAHSYTVRETIPYPDRLYRFAPNETVPAYIREHFAPMPEEDGACWAPRCTSCHEAPVEVRYSRSKQKNKGPYFLQARCLNCQRQESSASELVPGDGGGGAEQYPMNVYHFADDNAPVPSYLLTHYLRNKSGNWTPKCSLCQERPAAYRMGQQHERTYIYTRCDRCARSGGHLGEAARILPPLPPLSRGEPTDTPPDNVGDSTDDAKRYPPNIYTFADHVPVPAYIQEHFVKNLLGNWVPCCVSCLERDKKKTPVRLNYRRRKTARPLKRCTLYIYARCRSCTDAGLGPSGALATYSIKEPDNTTSPVVPSDTALYPPNEYHFAADEPVPDYIRAHFVQNRAGNWLPQCPYCPQGTSDKRQAVTIVRYRPRNPRSVGFHERLYIYRRCRDCADAGRGASDTLAVVTNKMEGFSAPSDDEDSEPENAASSVDEEDDEEEGEEEEEEAALTVEALRDYPINVYRFAPGVAVPAYIRGHYMARRDGSWVPFCGVCHERPVDIREANPRAAKANAREHTYIRSRCDSCARAGRGTVGFTTILPPPLSAQARGVLTRRSASSVDNDPEEEEEEEEAMDPDLSDDLLASSTRPNTADDDDNEEEEEEEEEYPPNVYRFADEEAVPASIRAHFVQNPRGDWAPRCASCPPDIRRPVQVYYPNPQSRQPSKRHSLYIYARCGLCAGKGIGLRGTLAIIRTAAAETEPPNPRKRPREEETAASTLPPKKRPRIDAERESDSVEEEPVLVLQPHLYRFGDNERVPKEVRTQFVQNPRGDWVPCCTECRRHGTKRAVLVKYPRPNATQVRFRDRYYIYSQCADCARQQGGHATASIIIPMAFV